MQIVYISGYRKAFKVLFKQWKVCYNPIVKEALELSDRRLLEQFRSALVPVGDRLVLCPAGETPQDVLSRPVGGGEFALWCRADEPNAEALLALGVSLAAAILKETAPTSTDERWRRRLTDPKSDDLPYPCCVLLLQAPDGLPEGLQDAIPLNTQDVFVPIDSCTAAVVRSLKESADAAETAEYAGALRDSLLAELGCETAVGVGDAGSSPARSFTEASEALRLGRCYDPERGVYVWKSMLIERIADDLPDSAAETYRSLLFNQETARLLDAELLATALTLLRCGLNLSDTARRLFIHRSTLMYRLDKLQRATGLDLRNFDDATAFRLLYTLRRRSTDPSTQIKEVPGP